MASSFSLRQFKAGELPSPPADPSWLNERHRSPATVLEEPGGAARLALSTARFTVDEGHLFAQPALSDYFGLLSPNLPRTEKESRTVTLPVRRFEPSSLVTSDGLSVIWELLRRVDYLFIEDADIRPNDLLAHVSQFGLKDVRVHDMTSVMGLTGNYAYLLTLGIRLSAFGEALA